MRSLSCISTRVQVAASGVAFVATGNLAASYGGSVITQMLFSLYQRNSLNRADKVGRSDT